MEVRKRTEITVETNEVLMLRRARVYRALCLECGREVDMVSLLDAGAIAGLATDSARPANWHVFTDRGGSLVCMESVLKSI
jgi:hypothetical protein